MSPQLVPRPCVYPGQVKTGTCFVLLFQQELCLNIQSALQVLGRWQSDILLFSLSFPAHWLHGDAIVLQLNRGLAASLVGQRSKVLRPAQLPRWHCPVAGNAFPTPVRHRFNPFSRRK